MRTWSNKTGLSIKTLMGFAGMHACRFYEWRERYGMPNQHNSDTPHDNWLSSAEKTRILDFHRNRPLNGYKRLCFMMIDESVVICSPRTVYNVLKEAKVIGSKENKPSLKGTGFVQPTRPHEHWHIDVSYLNIKGTFYYLCSVLDGYSRYIVHWEIRESMTERDVEQIVQRSLEKFPGEKPRIISDRGPQFISRDFKNYVRLMGMDHVMTSPYYPQSNGKIERWHRELKSTTIRPKAPSSVDEARVSVKEFVDDYNDVRLHAGLGYIRPRDKLLGREEQIFADRKRKMVQAKVLRKKHWQQERLSRAGATIADGAGHPKSERAQPLGEGPRVQPSGGDTPDASFKRADAGSGSDQAIADGEGRIAWEKTVG